jgi:hypothetical protein
MLTMLAALAAAAQQAPPANAASLGQTAWIFSTIDHSEFCPAGNVKLDLRSGRYEPIQGAARKICDEANLERPVKSGKLGANQLARIQEAYLRVLNEGFESKACRNGEKLDHIIVSNGGTPILVLTTGNFSAIAPENLTCWSDSANAFHKLLGKTFGSSRQR